MQVTGVTLTGLAKPTPDDTGTLMVMRHVNGTMEAAHNANDALILDTDQRGFSRRSVGPSIGAFEANAARCTIARRLLTAQRSPDRRSGR